MPDRCATSLSRVCQMAVVMLSLTIPASARGEIIDRVLAIVGGELIMLSDVTAARDFGLLELPQSHDAGRPEGGADDVAVMLTWLIDRAIVLAQVERYAPPEPSPDAVDRELARVRARFPSAAAFAEALARSGIDEPHLRDALRQNLRIRAYEEERFAVPAPADADLARYYREHPQAFTRQGTLTSFEDARPDIVRELTAERRNAAVASWVEDLRRRADVIDLYSAIR